MLPRAASMASRWRRRISCFAVIALHQDEFAQATVDALEYLQHLAPGENSTRLPSRTSSKRGNWSISARVWAWASPGSQSMGGTLNTALA